MVKHCHLSFQIFLVIVENGSCIRTVWRLILYIGLGQIGAAMLLVSVRCLLLCCRSFGVTLWELVTFGSLPYAELSNEQVLQMVIFERSVRLLKPEIPITNLDHL